MDRLREKVARVVFFLSAASAALILFSIVVFLFKESWRFFSAGDLHQFMSGTRWAPSQNVYGAGTFIAGSVLATLGALLIAVPLGLACSIFLAEIAPRNVSKAVRPAIELLAGIPSIVYGLFALASAKAHTRSARQDGRP
jgi:phosphate transport system permease protein